VEGLEGTNVGPYEIKRLLGAGGMGQVYRAHDPRLEREVAMKVLSTALAKEPGYLERFRREARAVAKLNHPNIVPVYDFGEQGDLTYLVMPLISGGTLRDYLAHRQVLPLSEAVSIAEQVAGALQYAHERGLVHRDVKPANILMSDEGRALLSDFGIVRLVQKADAAATLTHMGAFVGSPEYAAPEMVVGEAIDHRVDVYALGVLLFQMLTGRLPFTGATAVSLLMMQAQQPPPPPRSLNPAISPAMEAVILKALAKQPAGRYQTMVEFQAALRAASAAPSAGTTYTTAAPAAGTIADLPTISSYGVPPAPGSGPAVFPAAGPGSGPPPVWGGPGSGAPGWAAPGSGPAAMPPGSVPPGWAMPGSGPAVMSPGSGAPGWATPGNSPAVAPPLPPTYATGLSVLPQQAPVAPPPTKSSGRRRALLIVLPLLALVLVGGSLGALSLFSKKTGTPPPGATSTSVVSKATATLTPKPATPAGITTEFALPTANGGPSAITAGPGSALWFTEGTANKIGRITLGGDITEFPASSSNQNYGQGITAGPDGNIWFTEPASSDNWIGRITPDGTITKFAVPTANGSPVGITVGPDGNLWFAESNSAKIGRITPGGAIAEFAVPIANSTPFYITAGPDGALWFTDPGTNAIGRMTLSGAVTEYPVSTAQSGLIVIAAGPDKNLWFTENAGNKVGRITPRGTITEFAIPTTDSFPVGIVAGPDGNLWFTENAGNKVGRITPGGNITEFPVPTANGAQSGIVAGPDGNLWFAENASNKIGRITSGK
jgi:streptogramin lyase